MGDDRGASPARTGAAILSALGYDREREGPTLRSFRAALRRGEAHCLEAAMIAALMLEQHNYPPLLLSLESQDKLDHVVFLYRQKNLWGAIARSRDTRVTRASSRLRQPASTGAELL